jgi:hypothetical protein
MTICLTLDNFRHLCFELAAASAWNTPTEPIPDFDTRYPGRLESCLATPERKRPKCTVLLSVHE